MKFKEENKIDMYQMWMATFSSFSNYSDDLISSIMFDTLVAIPNSQDTMPSLFFDSLMEMHLPNCQIKRFNKFS